MRKLLLIVVVFFQAACMTVETRIDFVDGTNFKHFHTFYWAGKTAATTGDPRIDENTMLADRIQATSVAALIARGFTPAPVETADMKVSWNAGILQKVDPDPSKSVTIMSPPGSLATVKQEGIRAYEQAVLTLEILDSKTDKAVWQAVIKGELYESTPPETRARRIHDAVAAALSKFPPH